MEIPAVRHITGKNAGEPIYGIGFRNRLLAIPFINSVRGLSSSFYFLILFFDARSLGPQIMIGWARE